MNTGQIQIIKPNSTERIIGLIEKASATQDADDALKFAQAADHAADAIVKLASLSPVTSIGFNRQQDAGEQGS